MENGEKQMFIIFAANAFEFKTRKSIIASYNLLEFNFGHLLE